MNDEEVRSIIELVLDEAAAWFKANDPEGEIYYPDYALKSGFGRDEIVQSVLNKLRVEKESYNEC